MCNPIDTVLELMGVKLALTDDKPKVQKAIAKRLKSKRAKTTVAKKKRPPVKKVKKKD
jgi:transcriptional regulator